MSLRKYSVLGIVSVLVLCLPATGQQMIRDGNALDANPQRGSGGFNPAARVYEPNATNRIVTGNVSGGRAFQGYSPIRDSSSLFLGSPNYSGYGVTSSSNLRTRSGYASGYAADPLSSFYRDSYSYSDNRDPYTPAWQSGTYYSSTAYATGYGASAQSYNRVGSAYGGGPYPYPRSGRLLGTTTFDPLVAARQSLQGGTVPAQLPDLYQTNAGRIPADQLVREAAQDQATTGATGPRPLTSLVDTRVKAPGPEDPRRMDNRLSPAMPPARMDSLESILERGRNLETRLAKPINRPMQPGGSTPVEPPQAPTGWPDAVPETSGADQATSLLSIPFVAKGDSAVGVRLSQASKSLKDGKYYQAAGQFEIAQMMDPQDPAPALGRSMALLGAGEYLTSASALFQAVRLLDQMKKPQPDLLAFARDLKNINDRIVELKGRLESEDDYRLRFLLGYAEFAVGLSDLGMTHMERGIAIRTRELAESRDAANLALATRPAGSGQTTHPELQSLARFVHRLGSGGASPSAKPATQPAGT
ncbi:MAG TPA: hypothetical protein PKY77_21460 [Phycisphaerae bacterium]|nr:hypothetical protein [Phycisphaerae bacterium]HRY71149.1 hypothetical protein [Phycisphaerae bacterium]HSA29781.1 hypothetical protein [Phycisphaerae bacterium]